MKNFYITIYRSTFEWKFGSACEKYLYFFSCLSDTLKETHRSPIQIKINDTRGMKCPKTNLYNTMRNEYQCRERREKSDTLFDI